MRPVMIKDCNADFAKPRDWNEGTMGPCGNLPIRRQAEGSNGGAYMAYLSNWKPSERELAILAAGGVVELCCCGVQPAVAVAAVPCADPSVPPGVLDEAFLRNVLADELEREGARYLAVAVRNGTDNSSGGTGALAALKKVTGLL